MLLGRAGEWPGGILRKSRPELLKIDVVSQFSRLGDCVDSNSLRIQAFGNVFSLR